MPARPKCRRRPSASVREANGRGRGGDQPAVHAGVPQPSRRHRSSSLRCRPRSSIRSCEKFIMQLEAQLSERNVTFELTEEAIEWLAEKGYDEQMGARPLCARHPGVHQEAARRRDPVRQAQEGRHRQGQPGQGRGRRERPQARCDRGPPCEAGQARRDAVQTAQAEETQAGQGRADAAFRPRRSGRARAQGSAQDLNDPAMNGHAAGQCPAAFRLLSILWVTCRRFGCAENLIAFDTILP